MQRDIQALRAPGQQIGDLSLGLKGETVKALINQNKLEQEGLEPLQITERLTVDVFCDALDAELNQALDEMKGKSEINASQGIRRRVLRGLASIAGAGLVGGGLTAIALLVVGATSTALAGLSMAVNIPLIGSFSIIGLGAVVGAAVGGLGYGLWSAYKGHQAAVQQTDISMGSITGSSKGAENFDVTQAASGGASMPKAGGAADEKSRPTSSLAP